MNERQTSISASHPAKVIGLFVAMTTCVVIVIAALAIASEIFLILFLAILFGVFLSRTSQWFASRLAVGYGWCLAFVTTTLVVAMIGSTVSFGVQIDSQVVKARKHLGQGEDRVQDIAKRYPSVRSMLRSTPVLRELVKDTETDSSESGTSSQNDSQSGEKSEVAPLIEQSALRSTAKKGITAFASLFKTAFGLLVNGMLIFFVGLFVATAPQMYRDGIVILFPTERRQRAREVMDMMGDALWHWLIGRFGSMLVTGCGAGAILFVLGVPMAITLGFVTALLTFVPNIGGLIALTLAVLFALPQSGSTVAMVIVGFMALQLIESYIVTPLIQERQVSLPPALLIAFQVVMGVLFGFLGAAVASPLLAATKVCVEQAYVKDVLEANTDSDT